MMVGTCSLGLIASAALMAPVVETRGVITRVDLGKKELVLEGRGAARGTVTTFALDKSTEVLFGRQSATLDDLPVGRRARVEFEPTDGKPVARVIRVNGPKPAPRDTPRPGAKADENTIAGTLRRVAVTDREVVVVGLGARGAETETTIRIPEGAKLFREGKAVELRGLKEGDPARVQVSRRAGKLDAVEIQSGPGTPMTAPARGREPLLPMLRRALQMADQFLKMLEERNGPDR